MKHLFSNPLQSDAAIELAELPNEAAVRFLIHRVTTLADELETFASGLNRDAPATARHLRIVTQQLASLTLAAVETWPKTLR